MTTHVWYEELNPSNNTLTREYIGTVKATPAEFLNHIAGQFRIRDYQGISCPFGFCESGLSIRKEAQKVNNQESQIYPKQRELLAQAKEQYEPQHHNPSGLINTVIYNRVNPLDAIAAPTCLYKNNNYAAKLKPLVDIFHQWDKNATLESITASWAKEYSLAIKPAHN